MCGFVPATTFFLVTNFAYWVFMGIYPKTWAGLMECYAQGLPFYRAMIAGDLFYLSIVLACWAAATAYGTASSSSSIVSSSTSPSSTTSSGTTSSGG